MLVLGAGCVSDKKSLPPIPPVVPGTIEQIHMLTSPFAVNLDGVPGPDGIAAKVYAGSQNQPRFFPIESGTLEILMFDGWVSDLSASASIPLRVWKFTAEELKAYELPSAVGTGYQLALPWGDKRPTKTRLTVVARYTSAKGAAIYSSPSIIAMGK